MNYKIFCKAQEAIYDFFKRNNLLLSIHTQNDKEEEGNYVKIAFRSESLTKDIVMILLLRNFNCSWHTMILKICYDGRDKAIYFHEYDPPNCEKNDIYSAIDLENAYDIVSNTIYGFFFESIKWAESEKENLKNIVDKWKAM